MSRLHRLLLYGILFLPAAANAAIINLGFFSFDNLIPADSAPGVNVFNVTNFSGAFDLPPDFPVATDVTFQNSFLDVYYDGGGWDHFSLGDIGPGPFSPPDSIEFPDTINFLDATFTATLSDVVFDLDGGGTFTAASATISATILPSAGSDLATGTDFALISVSDSAPAPEPATGLLGAAGIGAVLLLAVRRQRV